VSVWRSWRASSKFARPSRARSRHVYVDTGALIRAAAARVRSLTWPRWTRSAFKSCSAGLPARHNDGFIRASSRGRVPDRTFEGKILRTSGAFNPTTRTLLTEIEVPIVTARCSRHPRGRAVVRCAGQSAHHGPATAVIVRTEGLQVAVVNNADAIQLQKVQVGRDWAGRWKSSPDSTTARASSPSHRHTG